MDKYVDFFPLVLNSNPLTWIATGRNLMAPDDFKNLGLVFDKKNGTESTGEKD
jgi:hypothetical protein